MKNRLIASIGLLVVFVMCIFPPNQFSQGRLLLAFSPGFGTTLYALLSIAVFFASLVGVAIFITLLLKKPVIPVIVDWICMIIAVVYVVCRFIFGGGLINFYFPTTYFFVAGAVISLIFLLKYRSSGD